MKLAVIADIHNNKKRLAEVFDTCKKEKIDVCICCGDISSLNIVNSLGKSFRKVYIALGNADFNLKNSLSLFPENIDVSPDILETNIDGLKVAVVHYDYKVNKLLKENIYDVVFYGHTHTPWEKKTERNLLLNPGEVSGQFGRASFAIFDTKTRKTVLKILQ